MKTQGTAEGWCYQEIIKWLYLYGWFQLSSGVIASRTYFDQTEALHIYGCKNDR